MNVKHITKTEKEIISQSKKIVFLENYIYKEELKCTFILFLLPYLISHRL